MHAIQATTRVLNCADEHLNVQSECVKGFVYKVQVDYNIKPVQQKVQMSNEIQWMLRAGIIETIDARPTVSPFVVTIKETRRNLYACRFKRAKYKYY